MLPYSPLHHLLLADAGATLVMTSGNVSDEPIAYRDDDALERLARDRRPVPGPRPPDRDAHRRLGRARRWRAGRAAQLRPAPLARLRAGEPAAARPARARPLLACGAELKNTFCLAKGDARVGQPPHRRPRELRDAALVHRRDRALRAAVRGRARGRRARPAPRVPVDQVRARARRRRAGRRPAPPRPPRGVPGRARRGRARGRRDLRRHRLRHRRDRVGRRAAASATSRTSAASGRCVPVRLPGGERAIREPWRMACAWLVGGARRRARRAPARRSPARVDDRAWAQVQRGSRAPGRPRR